MRTMIDLGKERGPLGIHIIDTATNVDCGSREVGLRRSLRSLLHFIVPACCAAGFHPHSPTANSSSSSSSFSSSDTDSPSSSTPSATMIRSWSSSSLSSTTSVVKGTFFGQRNGRVSFCLQEDHRTRRRTAACTASGPSSFAHPLLLLEFAVPTCYLAKEMQHGLLRIALVEEGGGNHPPTDGGAGGIFQVPVWCMYCNGRKVGFATRRKMTAADTTSLTRMQSVSVGAGVLPPDGTMYLRANFRRIIGSPDSESFHMINPDRKGPSSACDGHSSGQELSIFLLRSSSS